MHVSSFMLANAAAVENGLLNVAGAGWSEYTVPSLPAVIVGAAAGIIDVDAEEVGSTPVISLTVSDPEDRAVAVTTGEIILNALTVRAAPGLPGRIPFAIEFYVSIADPMPSSVSVLLSAADGPLAEQSFRLVQGW